MPTPGFAPASMGFGHGPFGHGPFGHGPWVTFPFTPTYVYGEAATYRVATHRFEDLSEARDLTSRQRGLTFTYEFGRVDSATATAIMSWVAATVGGAARFRAIDHATGQSYIVRLAVDPWGMLRGPGPVRTLPAFPLKVVHADSGTV